MSGSGSPSLAGIPNYISFSSFETVQLGFLFLLTFLQGSELAYGIEVPGPPSVLELYNRHRG